MEYITLSHGSGGSLSQKLIAEVFHSVFRNEYLDELDDAAVLALGQGQYALTTDSYVIDPIFFPGGDIGKLCVCGTVNDLASCGAAPQYLTAGFILEEGLSVKDLKRVVLSMAREAKLQGVKVVTGDTKVVERGKCDKIFINTSGLGLVKKQLKASMIRPGDKILINGPIAQHGLAVLLAREKFSYKARIESDCNSLWRIVKLLIQAYVDVHFMRDPTRGGISATTNEIAGACGYSFILEEKKIPITASCRNLCEILGLEPCDIANEGKMLFFVAQKDAARALKILKKDKLGKNAAIIGEVLPEKNARVFIKTSLGGEKILGMPVGESLPRIC